jgi:hypothetical protein
VPFTLAALTLWGIWWYVVIHQQVAVEAAPEALQQLGTPICRRPRRRPPRRVRRRTFTCGTGIIFALMTLIVVRYYWRMDATGLQV